MILPSAEKQPGNTISTFPLMFCRDCSAAPDAAARKLPE